MKSILSFLTTILPFYLLSGNPFIGSQAIVSTEFVYKLADVPFPSCHASTIVETDEGLVAAWFGGTHEKHTDVGIWISCFSDGKWSVPVEVANGIQHGNLRYPTWNPVLFNYGDEPFLFYKEGPNPREWWGEYITSLDNGKSWSRPYRLPEEIFGPIKNKPELLENEVLICPSSTEDDGWRVHMEFTSDRGKSWERTGPLNDGKSLGAIQPSILKHKNQVLQMVCRSRNKKILTSWSYDQGRTWTSLEKTGLPIPNSGIDAVTLADGRHVVVYNHIIDTSPEWGKRNILNIAVSDDGINWKAAVLLENDADPKGEYSYPAIIQTADGLIHITYTWNRKLIKYVIVDPDKFKLKKIKNGEWPGL